MRKLVNKLLARPAIPISLGKDGVHLSFTLYELPAFDTYHLEINKSQAPEGTPPLWRQSVLRQKGDAFYLGLNPGFLTPGDYEFRLYGEADARNELLATYTIRFHEDRAQGSS